MTNGLPRLQPDLQSDLHDDREGLPKPQFHRNEAAYAFLPSPGPTVVVRHRRRVLPEAATPVIGPPSGDFADAARLGGPAAKMPKVYTVPSQHVAGAASVPQPADAVGETPATRAGEPPAEPLPVTAPRRRRRNELRAPLLLRHVVFEAAPPSPDEASLADGDAVAAAGPDTFMPPGDVRHGYEAVCAALDGVREALDRAHRARRFRPIPAASRS